MDTVQALATNIRTLRERANLTQEALGTPLSVTGQAVSRWEKAQSAPDVALLPELADIFGVSMDVLFGREPLPPVLPWSDDDRLHLAVFRGHCMLENGDGSSRLMFSLDGDACDVDCRGNLEIHGNVEGNVTADGRLTCGNVGGNANAGDGINCGNIGSHVNASGGVNCGSISGDVNTGGSVNARNIGGNASANEIHCHTVKGDVDAENVYHDQ